MNGALNLTSVGAVASFALRIVCTMNSNNITVLILVAACALGKVCMHQTNLITREHSEVFLNRLLHEVLSLDIELTCERNLTGAEFFVLEVVWNLKHLHLTFRIIVYDKLNRVKNSHYSRLLHLQIFSYAVFKHRIIRA